MGSGAGGLSAEQLLSVYERLPEMVILVDEAGVIVHANQTMRGLMGYELDEVVGTNIFDYVHPDDLAYMAWSWEARSDHPGEPGMIVQGRARNADGTWRACEVIGLNLLDDAAASVMVLTARDLSNQSALADSPARLRSMIDRTTDLVLLLDAEGRFVYVNRRLTSRFGHDQDRVVGNPWTSILDPAERDAADRWFAALVGADGVAHPRIRLRLRDAQGRLHDVEWNGSNQMDDPVIGGVIVGGRDVSGIVALERQLRDQNALLQHAAEHDPLTGLLNRPAFLSEVARQLDLRRGTDEQDDAVVLFCDLDGFKAVNDEYGHAAGDEVLAAVAARLADHVRAGDVVARYGGDEFTILLGDSAGTGVVQNLVARLQEALAEPVVVGEVTAVVGVTIGTARAAVAVADVDSLLGAADAAMYRQKRNRGTRDG